MQALVAFAAKAHEVTAGVVAGIAVTMVDHLGRPGADCAQWVPSELEMSDSLPVRAVAAFGRVSPDFVLGAAAKSESLIREVLVLWAIPSGISRQIAAARLAAWFRRSWRHTPTRHFARVKIWGPTRSTGRTHRDSTRPGHPPRVSPSLAYIPARIGKRRSWEPVF